MSSLLNCHLIELRNSQFMNPKSFLKAELAEAKKGLAQYQARVDALEQAVTQMEGGAATTAEATRGRKKSNATSIAAPAGKTARGRKKDSEAAPAVAAKRGRKKQDDTAVATPAGKTARGAKKSASAGNGSKADSATGDLPSTKGDFWYNFVNDAPQTAAEIGNAAVASLRFTPSGEQVKVLKQRVTPALNLLVNSKRIKDSGSGRERRFVRK
jgi:hypothetical protein